MGSARSLDRIRADGARVVHSQVSEVQACTHIDNGEPDDVGAVEHPSREFDRGRFEPSHKTLAQLSIVPRPVLVDKGRARATFALREG